MTDDCCYKLYMHINKTNGKVYIGQTKQSYGSRWRDGEGYGSRPRFAKAIKKYGWNGFEHIPLIEKLSKIDVDYFECFFIAFFDSQNPEFGYNLTAGGDENPMDNSIIRENHREAMKKLHADPEWRENVRKANQKLSTDPEWLRKNREVLKKRHANPEWREKNREAMKKLYADPEYRKKHREAMKKLCKKVRCVETNIAYDSLKDACVAVNLKTQSHIGQCCSGKRKTAGGYHWEYA